MDVSIATETARNTTDLILQFRDVRQRTEDITEPLSIEDFVVQPTVEASPTKWHLAHTTWFFETFLLEPHVEGFEPHSDEYRFLFNSYYNTIGEQHSRAWRGLISRPTVDSVWEYRRHVDNEMEALLRARGDDPEIQRLVRIGIHHEQQHQELMLTDLKTLFGKNPLYPTYRNDLEARPHHRVQPVSWFEHGGGIVEIGHGDPSSFHFDNEAPRHRALLEPFALANRLVTCGEFLEFIKAGGYEIPSLWLSEGWNTVKELGWKAPEYWKQTETGWCHITLGGFEPVRLHEPVCHVSYYEAEAYARWAGARLPREEEWEAVATQQEIAGNTRELDYLHPSAAENGGGIEQLFGDVWEWTQSPYVGYPGYAPLEGALGEYNGKFMCNQFVLRGGSCVSPVSHLRATYRNFFPPDARWQFSGFRLARDS